MPMGKARPVPKAGRANHLISRLHGGVVGEVFTTCRGKLRHFDSLVRGAEAIESRARSSRCIVATNASAVPFASIQDQHGRYC